MILYIYLSVDIDRSYIIIIYDNILFRVCIPTIVYVFAGLYDHNNTICEWEIVEKMILDCNNIIVYCVRTGDRDLRCTCAVLCGDTYSAWNS